MNDEDKGCRNLQKKIDKLYLPFTLVGTTYMCVKII